MANKVSYILNGKVFGEYGAYVSQSHGLVDKLEPKKVLSFDWPEYDGTQYDLGARPKYKERIITLDMFFLGDNWQDLLDNFESIMSEFDRVGTQRLIVYPMGYDELVFDVIRSGVTPLNKQFNDGQMVGTSTLSLVEPYPIKVVLKYSDVSSTVNIKYESQQQTIININGNETIHSGDVETTLATPNETSYITITGEIRNLVTNATEL